MNCLRFYSQRQVNLINCFRTLWVQHIMWTRSFIISTAADLEDLEPVTKRLLQNPEDFACIFDKYFSQRCVCKFKELFTEHILIGGDLVNAMKDNETEKIPEIRENWYENADELARFFAKINSCWSERCWREMLHKHIKVTIDEAQFRLCGKYADDIKAYAIIENDAMKMADYMAVGIIKYCNI